MRRLAAGASAWARARICLNTGDLEAATRFGIDAFDRSRLPKPVGIGRRKITGSAAVPSGWAFFSPEHGVIVLNEDVWTAHQSHPQAHVFAAQIEGMDESAWVAYDRASWQLLDELHRGMAFSDEVPVS